mgnify:CR=1 FL=1
MGSVSMDNGDIIGILDLTLLDRGVSEAVSYTHLTLPTNREV